MSQKTPPVIPDNLRQLRACISCSLIKTTEQFITDGCENCPNLRMQGDRSKVEDCTSSSFEGMIAATEPNQSWVARWQGFERCVRGIYAVTVYGELPDGI